MLHEFAGIQAKVTISGDIAKKLHDVTSFAPPSTTMNYFLPSPTPTYIVLSHILSHIHNDQNGVVFGHNIFIEQLELEKVSPHPGLKMHTPLSQKEDTQQLLLHSSVVLVCGVGVVKSLSGESPFGDRVGPLGESPLDTGAVSILVCSNQNLKS